MNENRKTPVAAVMAMLLVTIAVVVVQNITGNREVSAGQEISAAWLADIESGADHVSAEELCTRLLAGDRGLLLIDVRPIEEYRDGHLPGAVHASVPEVLGDRWQDRIAAAELVVLYSNGSTHPGQAWVELRRRGIAHARVLDGGLAEFRRMILTPPSLRGVTTRERSEAEMRRHRLVRSWFAGDAMPSRAQPAGDPPVLDKPTMVSAGWLRERIGQVLVIDTRRDVDAFRELHVPGAVSVTPSAVRVRRGDRDLHLTSPDERARLFGSLGITRDTPVVLMGDEHLADATLVATALSTLGHRRLAILDGGIAAWASIRGPLTAATSQIVATDYRPVPDGLSITIDEVAAAVAKGEVQVVDVRPTAAFTGEVSTEARPGHVPGAISRPTASEYDTFGRWRELDRIVAEHQKLGIDPDRPIVVMCRTGHTATATAYLMQHLLGYRNVRWFNGSWTEWAERRDLPAAIGEGGNG
ncbi:MAG: rhodanese-like domain-containing protein [Planctomycetota bacterium]